MFYLLVLSLTGLSQSDPIFTTWEGNVYDFPKEKITIGKSVRYTINDHYTDSVSNYRKIGELSMLEINVLITNTYLVVFQELINV